MGGLGEPEGVPEWRARGRGEGGQHGGDLFRSGVIFLQGEYSLLRMLCLFYIENTMSKKDRVTVSPLSPSFKIRTPRGTHK